MKLVAISLADQANDDGVCWPGVASIRVRTGLSERSVQSAIKKLVDSCYVKIELRAGTTTRYTITAESFQPPQHVHPRSTCTPANGAGTVPQHVHPTPAARAPKPTRTIKEATKKKERTHAPDGASMFPGVNPQIVADFGVIRKAKRMPLTQTAVVALKREATKAGLTLEQALTVCCENTWAGFKASWLTERGGLAQSRDGSSSQASTPSPAAMRRLA
jgi:hypothetical protein